MLLAIGLAANTGGLASRSSPWSDSWAGAGRTGHQPGESWLVITTPRCGCEHRHTSWAAWRATPPDVSANHWPRGWYRRAVANPEVEVVRGGEKLAFRAVPVTGAERDQISRDYPLPFWVRLLTGFPPRSYLRLDPR